MTKVCDICILPVLLQNNDAIKKEMKYVVIKYIEK